METFVGIQPPIFWAGLSENRDILKMAVPQGKMDDKPSNLGALNSKCSDDPLYGAVSFALVPCKHTQIWAMQS